MMRNFGISDTQTNLYNIKRDKRIFSVGIKGQCAGNYFYTKIMKIDAAMGKVEGEASGILREIIDRGVGPSVGSRQHHQLVNFVALQHGRTPGAAEEIDDLFNTVGKKMIEEDLKAQGGNEELLKHLPKVRINRTHSTLSNVLEFSLMAPLLRDLNIEILEADDDQDFVLGDDPVVLTNKYINTHLGRPNCGFSVAGLIVLMPVSPNKTLMLSDGKVYETEKRKRLTQKQTVALNLLQVRHATSNVYFQDHAQVRLTLERSAALAPFARSSDPTVGSFREGEKRGIFFAHAREALTMPQEVQLRLKFSSKRNRDKGTIDPVRNREMTAAVRAVMKDPTILRGI